MFFLIVCIVLTLIIFFFAGKIVFNSSKHAEEIKCRMGTVRWLACVIIDSILNLLLF